MKSVHTRVMIGEGEVPRYELNMEGELNLKTEDGSCRGIEERLRRTLYLWKHMRVDLVVEPYVDICGCH